MYQIMINKQDGSNWVKDKKFKTFEKAYIYAISNLCQCLFFEGSKDKTFWYSDNDLASESYKVAIINQTNSYR